MWLVGLPVEVLPSPKLQLSPILPTPPEFVAVKVTAWFTVEEGGLEVKLTVRELATLMVWLDVAFAPLESVTVTITVKEPDVV